MSGPLFAEYDRLARVGLCAPTHFSLGEPINVIQERQLAAGTTIDPARARAAHDELAAALRAAGAAVVEIQPDPRFPYQVNPRDAGLATRDGLLLARFRLPVRQGEELAARQAAERAGLPIIGAVQRSAFEGGDFMALGSGLAAVGLGGRTEPGALDELAELLGGRVELLGVPFESRYLHLDMIFNLVGERLALACPSALPGPFLARLAAEGIRLLEVAEQEVFRHGCNVLATGPGRVLSHTANGRVNDLLRAEGFVVTAVDVAELARGGGGPRCLTLPLERGGER